MTCADAAALVIFAPASLWFWLITVSAPFIALGLTAIYYTFKSQSDKIEQDERFNAGFYTDSFGC